MNFAASRGTPDFSPAQYSSGRVGSNAGSAAGANSLSGVYGALREKAPKYDDIVGTAADVDTAKEIAGLEVEAAMKAAGLRAYGSAARSKLEAQMYDKAASAAKSGGMMGMFGGIAGGVLSLATGGLA